ncbi:MAG: hypothetical protein HOO86_11610 [Bacteroidales bacterium]|nr:hypothetical protein [Bacteroidales bacterium]
MKTTRLLLTYFVVTLLVITSFSGCNDRTYEKVTYTANIPVYLDFDTFRKSVMKSTDIPLTNPGKIYFKDNFLFINEINKGIHIIDNSSPAQPVTVAFIQIPGNMDMAMRNNILLADSYIDLVAIDITDPMNPVEIDRIQNAFPNVLPAPDYSYPVYGLDFSKGVVTGWETKEITEMIEKGSYYGKDIVLSDGLGVPTIGSAEVSINPSVSGISGSMARFTVNDDYLYAVQNNSLKLFNVGSIPGITTGQDVMLDRMVETIFPYDNKLFLGTTTGMVVYDITSPATPTYLSSFNHINSCDPVAIEGNYAYVTLRSGTQCNGFTNQLDVVDISSIANPFLVKSYPMFNPYGLAIENHILFICDGDAGLKVYDATDPQEITQNQIAHFKDIKTYDVIPLDGLLMMIGADGLYQYDYSNLDSLILISQIPVSIP